MTEADVGATDDQRVARAGELRAGGGWIHRQRAGAAAEQELRPARAPRRQAGRGQGGACVGTKVPIAAAESRHVRSRREGLPVVEGEDAGARADHAEVVVKRIQGGLFGRQADAQDRKIERTRRTELQRRAPEVGGRTQAERRGGIDDHGGAGGAEGGVILVDAHGTLLDIEASRPARVGGVVVQVIVPVARLGQAARAL